jgi:hypothetical protein
MAIKHIVAELVDAGAKQVVAGVPPALHLAVKYAARRDTAVVEMLLKWLLVSTIKTRPVFILLLSYH